MIRKATIADIEGIDLLLSQVLEVHHDIRPDLFKSNTRKYTDEELKTVIEDPDRPIFVYEESAGIILGYVFCIITEHKNDNILTDIKTLYIDDLCVDRTRRGERIGKKLYEYAINYAGNIGCYNVTLNVWEGNDGAKAFYESLGMKPQKYGMETIL